MRVIHTCVCIYIQKWYTGDWTGDMYRVYMCVRYICVCRLECCMYCHQIKQDCIFSTLQLVVNPLVFFCISLSLACILTCHQVVAGGACLLWLCNTRQAP
jgi:hypothetical protein